MSECPVDTAILPVAGMGSRFLPATKVVAKELLVLVDRPLVQYVVEEAVSAGIRRIVFVDAPSKQGRVQRHFSPLPELHSALKKKGERTLVELLLGTVPAAVEFITVLQDEPRGLGDAVLRADSVVSGNAVAIMLPDMILSDRGGTDLSGMIAAYAASGRGQVMLAPVAEDSVDKYGIADLGGAPLASGKSVRIAGMVEKPARDSAPSNWAVRGRYVLPKSIFAHLRSTREDTHCEIQLTDALKRMIATEGLYSWGGLSTVHDCGDPLGYLKATHYFASRHPRLGESYRAWIASQRSDGD